MLSIVYVGFTVLLLFVSVRFILTTDRTTLLTYCRFQVVCMFCLCFLLLVYESGSGDCEFATPVIAITKAAAPAPLIAPFAPKLSLACESTLLSIGMDSAMPGTSLIGSLSWKIMRLILFQNRELGLDFTCFRFRVILFLQIVFDRGRTVSGGALIAGSCPVGCDASSAFVAGSYVFTPESGICKAAVHAKVL